MLPFFVFALMFLIIPTGYLVAGAFQDQAGGLTFDNITNLFTPTIIAAYWISIKVSLASAIGGAAVGFFMAYAVVLGGLPSWLRPTVMTFSGVASNFAGVPLAFAFIATLGRTGLVTALLVNYLGFNIYTAGFNLLSFWGLAITYLYFQIPADGPDHHAGDRRTARRSGVRPLRSSAPMSGNTGCTSLCRCCGRAFSARRCCFSPMPSAPWRPPMR